MNIRKLATTCLLLSGLSAAASVFAQDDRFANVSIETVPVTGNNVVKGTSISIRVMKSQQMSVEEAVAEGLSDDYESWGQGFVNEQRWIETVFASYPR